MKNQYLNEEVKVVAGKYKNQRGTIQSYENGWYVVVGSTVMKVRTKDLRLVTFVQKEKLVQL